MRKRPKKRLLKVDATQREALVGTFATLRASAEATGATIFGGDGAHFQVEVDLRANSRTAARVREQLDPLMAGLAERATRVQHRCRTVLQARADALLAGADQTIHAVPIVATV